MTWRWRRDWRASRIALRLLAFNILLVFVPIVGIRYLDVYEDRLLDAQERAMVQQGRMLAAAVGASPYLDAAAAQDILNRVGRRIEARLRIFDRTGALVADSARAPEPAGDESVVRSEPPAPGVRQRALYRLGALIARTRVAISRTLETVLGTDRVSEPSGQPEAPGGELKAALAGKYGAATRRTSGQRSLTMFTAVPVRHQEDVVGAVVVSQSTFRILQALYDIRLRVFQIVVASIAVAALLTAVAATTIVRPLTRLRRAAAAVSARRDPLPAGFPGMDRRDEIGELARALDELTRRLNAQIARLEGFAADLSHEFKNPLAGIRTAAETIDECDDPEERRRFTLLMIRDVQRLERLVSAVRDLARIDGELAHRASTIVPIPRLVGAVVEGLQATASRKVTIVLDTDGRPCHVRGDAESLVQVFENLVANALSFASPGTQVDVQVRQEGGSCHVSVADRGPGIPEAHLPRLFERFFSYRPGDERREHLGLGLAIARRIVEGHGGVISGANRADGGARFDVSLPLSTEAGDGPGTPAPASESVPGIAGAFPPQGSDPRHTG